MANQLYENGQLVDIEGQAFECVAVAVADLGEGTIHYTYSFRLKSEVDTQRGMEAERQAQQLELEANSTEPRSVETAPEAPKAEEPKEETQYVK